MRKGPIHTAKGMELRTYTFRGGNTALFQPNMATKGTGAPPHPFHDPSRSPLWESAGIRQRSEDGGRTVAAEGRVHPRTREGEGARRIQVIWPGKLAFQGQMTLKKRQQALAERGRRRPVE